jgi:hypothetical protein
LHVDLFCYFALAWGVSLVVDERVFRGSRA